MTALAWLATVLVVVTYMHLGRTGRARPFHIANVGGAVVLGTVNSTLGAWPQVVLNVMFGLAAVAALVKGDPEPCSA